MPVRIAAFCALVLAGGTSVAQPLDHLFKSGEGQYR
jgi:hypothetical protein